ncbi:MAG: patatin [Polaribacter sp.]|jgi:NTE family protein|nr:patatin [Polaribacter sp.]|tara:strand:+ start:374 stop:1135 length:762 start_codon:yes stop_codon:yes gene_type:complete
MINNKKFGLALGGGGARGYFHLGVAEILYKNEMYPDVISGVSAGAIAGAFLASGQKPVEIFKKLKKKRFFDMTGMNIPVSGLFSLNGLKKVVANQITEKQIEQLKTPLIIGITNMNTGEIEFREKGNLAELVQASSSAPFMFAPVMIGGQQYLDGGIFENLPVSPIRQKVDYLLGVNIYPVGEFKDMDNWVKLSRRMFQLGVKMNTKPSKKVCDYVIEPDEIEKYELYDASKADELFEMGLRYGEEFVKSVIS